VGVYFFAFWLFFWALYSILNGFYALMKDGFWGYHSRISGMIDRHTADASLYGQDELLVRTLSKQKQEIEDIMRQYVFFRFCERASVYLTQINMVILFCVSAATVVFIHAAFVHKAYMWLGLWLAVYGFYTWQELSGLFIRFEVWAANIFFKQYRVFTRAGGTEGIIEVKKENKKLLRRMYFFIILPISVISLLLLIKAVIYPVLPGISAALQADIFRTWAIIGVPGSAIAAAIPVALDRVMSARFRLSFSQIRESYYAVSIFVFLSFAVSALLSAARYAI